jgi:uncharacterized protein (TIGR03067 family)
MTSLIALILAVGGDNPKAGSVKHELKSLEGTWAVVALKVQGQKLPEDQLKKEQPLYVFKGEECTAKSGNKTINRAVIKIDPSKRPKTIDATGADGADRGQTIIGIYEIRATASRSVMPSRVSRGRPTSWPGTLELTETTTRSQLTDLR